MLQLADIVSNLFPAIGGNFNAQPGSQFVPLQQDPSSSSANNLPGLLSFSDVLDANLTDTQAQAGEDTAILTDGKSNVLPNKTAPTEEGNIPTQPSIKERGVIGITSNTQQHSSVLSVDVPLQGVVTPEQNTTLHNDLDLNALLNFGNLRYQSNTAVVGNEKNTQPEESPLLFPATAEHGEDYTSLFEGLNRLQKQRTGIQGIQSPLPQAGFYEAGVYSTLPENNSLTDSPYASIMPETNTTPDDALNISVELPQGICVSVHTTEKKDITTPRTTGEQVITVNMASTPKDTAPADALAALLSYLSDSDVPELEALHNALEQPAGLKIFLQAVGSSSPLAVEQSLKTFLKEKGIETVLMPPPDATRSFVPTLETQHKTLDGETPLVVNTEVLPDETESEDSGNLQNNAPALSIVFALSQQQVHPFAIPQEQETTNSDTIGTKEGISQLFAEAEKRPQPTVPANGGSTLRILPADVSDNRVGDSSVDAFSDDEAGSSSLTKLLAQPSPLTDDANTVQKQQSNIQSNTASAPLPQSLNVENSVQTPTPPALQTSSSDGQGETSALLSNASTPLLHKADTPVQTAPVLAPKDKSTEGNVSAPAASKSNTSTMKIWTEENASLPHNSANTEPIITHKKETTLQKQSPAESNTITLHLRLPQIDAVQSGSEEKKGEKTTIVMLGALLGSAQEHHVSIQSLRIVVPPSPTNTTNVATASEPLHNGEILHSAHSTKNEQQPLAPEAVAIPFETESAEGGNTIKTPSTSLIQEQGTVIPQQINSFANEKQSVFIPTVRTTINTENSPAEVYHSSLGNRTVIPPAQEEPSPTPTVKVFSPDSSTLKNDEAIHENNSVTLVNNNDTTVKNDVTVKKENKSDSTEPTTREYQQQRVLTTESSMVEGHPTTDIREHSYKSKVVTTDEQLSITKKNHHSVIGTTAHGEKKHSVLPEGNTPPSFIHTMEVPDTDRSKAPVMPNTEPSGNEAMQSPTALHTSPKQVVRQQVPANDPTENAFPQNISPRGSTQEKQKTAEAVSEPLSPAATVVRPVLEEPIVETTPELSTDATPPPALAQEQAQDEHLVHPPFGQQTGIEKKDAPDKGNHLILLNEKERGDKHITLNKDSIPSPSLAQSLVKDADDNADVALRSRDVARTANAEQPTVINNRTTKDSLPSPTIPNKQETVIARRENVLTTVSALPDNTEAEATPVVAPFVAPSRKNQEIASSSQGQISSLASVETQATPKQKEKDTLPVMANNDSSPASQKSEKKEGIQEYIPKRTMQRTQKGSTPRIAQKELRATEGTSANAVLPNSADEKPDIHSDIRSDVRDLRSRTEMFSAMTKISEFSSSHSSPGLPQLQDMQTPKHQTGYTPFIPVLKEQQSLSPLTPSAEREGEIFSPRRTKSATSSQGESNAFSKNRQEHKEGSAFNRVNQPHTGNESIFAHEYKNPEYHNPAKESVLYRTTPLQTTAEQEAPNTQNSPSSAFDRESINTPDTQNTSGTVPTTQPFVLERTGGEQQKDSHNNPAPNNFQRIAGFAESPALTRSAPARLSSEYAPLPVYHIPVTSFAPTTGLIVRNFPANEGGAVRLVLTPETLGTVVVQMRVGEEENLLRLEVESHEARNIIEAQLPALREQLAHNGVKMENITVQLKQNEASSSTTQQHSQQGQPNQQQRYDDREARSAFVRSFAQEGRVERESGDSTQGNNRGRQQQQRRPGRQKFEQYA